MEKYFDFDIHTYSLYRKMGTKFSYMSNFYDQKFNFERSEGATRKYFEMDG